MSEPRLTSNVLRVLSEIAGCSLREGASGADIARNTKLASGTLYPILIRLESAGWVDSKWEVGDPSNMGRPRKRFYRITGEGRLQLNSDIANEIRGLAFP